jgi:hypothetical protein
MAVGVGSLLTLSARAIDREAVLDSVLALIISRSSPGSPTMAPHSSDMESLDMVPHR